MKRYILLMILILYPVIYGAQAEQKSNFGPWDSKLIKSRLITKMVCKLDIPIIELHQNTYGVSYRLPPTPFSGIMQAHREVTSSQGCDSCIIITHLPCPCITLLFSLLQQEQSVRKSPQKSHFGKNSLICDFRILRNRQPGFHIIFTLWKE